MVLNSEIEKLLKQSVSFKFNGQQIPVIPFNNVKLYNDFRLWLADIDDENTVTQALQDYFKLCEASLKTAYDEGHLKNIFFDITGDNSVAYEVTGDKIKVLGLKDPSRVKSLLESIYMLKSKVTNNKLEIQIVLPAWEA